MKKDAQVQSFVLITVSRCLLSFSTAGNLALSLRRTFITSTESKPLLINAQKEQKPKDPCTSPIPLQTPIWKEKKNEREGLYVYHKGQGKGTWVSAPWPATRKLTVRSQSQVKMSSYTVPGLVPIPRPASLSGLSLHYGFVLKFKVGAMTLSLTRKSVLLRLINLFFQIDAFSSGC